MTGNTLRRGLLKDNISQHLSMLFQDWDVRHSPRGDNPRPPETNVGRSGRGVRKDKMFATAAILLLSRVATLILGGGGCGVCACLCGSACLRSAFVPVVAKYCPSTVASWTRSTSFVLLRKSKKWVMVYGAYLGLWGRRHVLAVEAQPRRINQCSSTRSTKTSLLLEFVYVMTMKVKHWLLNTEGCFTRC